MKNMDLKGNDSGGGTSWGHALDVMEEVPSRAHDVTEVELYVAVDAMVLGK